MVFRTSSSGSRGKGTGCQSGSAGHQPAAASESKKHWLLLINHMSCAHRLNGPHLRKLRRPRSLTCEKYKDRSTRPNLGAVSAEGALTTLYTPLRTCTLRAQAGHTAVGGEPGALLCKMWADASIASVYCLVEVWPVIYRYYFYVCNTYCLSQPCKPWACQAFLYLLLLRIRVPRRNSSCRSSLPSYFFNLSLPHSGVA